MDSKNKRKQRQDIVRNVAKENGACKDIPSFEAGVKWADYHPDWKEDTPKRKKLENGLPKLYFCQILTLDMTFGYRYSYRVGFINNEGKWNIENPMTKVMRYMDIYCNESETQLLTDIQKFNNENELA